MSQLVHVSSGVEMIIQKLKAIEVGSPEPILGRSPTRAITSFLQQFGDSPVGRVGLVPHNGLQLFWDRLGGWLWLSRAFQRRSRDDVCFCSRVTSRGVLLLLWNTHFQPGQVRLGLGRTAVAHSGSTSFGH